MNYRDEVEIDLIDLLHVILRKWRVIIVCMLLGALMLGVFSYLEPSVGIGDNAVKINVITRAELDAMRSKF